MVKEVGKGQAWFLEIWGAFLPSNTIALDTLREESCQIFESDGYLWYWEERGPQHREENLDRLTTRYRRAKFGILPGRYNICCAKTTTGSMGGDMILLEIRKEAMAVRAKPKTTRMYIVPLTTLDETA